MRRLFACVALLGAWITGCDEPSPASNIPVHVVDPIAANPALGCGPGTLELVVDQGGGMATFVASAAVDASGNFDVPLEIATYTAVTRIQMTMDLQECELVGAVPSFLLSDVPFVRVVMGRELSCQDLDEPQLTTGRTDPALVAFDGNLLIVGGTTRGTSTDRLVPIANPVLTYENAIPPDDRNPFPVLPRPMQATRASRFSVSRVVYATVDYVARFDTNLRSGAGARMLPTHDGSGGESAVVDLGAEGVAIVGGVDGRGDPVREISWIDPLDESIDITELATPRRNPVATTVGGVLVIAGGQAEGEPLFEVARLRSDGVALEGSPTEVREGAVLVAPQRRVGVLLGGLAADGTTVRDDTLVVTGCPDACRVSVGTPWAFPRLRPATAETVGGVWLLGGEAADGTAQATVEIVKRVGDAVSIEELADGLPTARARAGAALFADGIVAIIGGVDDEGEELRSMALCWPRELDPLN
ncbi:hypothetical protein [Sandaracinus amylolyticus]|uniref:Uncharacterized protein n=1 Tax=Sandaracinus amylolyticus TaxID=927083 RepID=A0A0F6W958_9BACT|nr:hypothetical protein [Sandaracinus amylolyticus]AKF10650.1 hypothetical protein DB32_007799 [Sandaracinus amylolyticus]